MIELSAEWASILVGVFLAWNAMLLVFIKWGLDRYERNLNSKLEHQDKSLASLQVSIKESNGCANSEVSRLERTILELRADLPNTYVQKEEWLRSWSGLDAKLVLLTETNRRIELVVEGLKERK